VESHKVRNTAISRILINKILIKIENPLKKISFQTFFK